MRSGAEIREMNTVRKHVSAIAGGRLAAASRAPVLALIISDVVGDDPTHIASGPCASDPTTIADARAILAKCRFLPGCVFRKPEVARRRKQGHRYRLSLARSCGRLLSRAGIRPEILGDTITGEARDVALDMARLARRTQGPAALISGGECTVTIRGEGGRGGRCSEFLLALGIESGGLWAIAADTDGIDGSEDNAGAVLTPDSMRTNVDARAYLDRHDSYSFFASWAT